MSTSQTYCQSFSVRYSEGDRSGRLKLRALFDYAQEAAGIHAADLGCSMEKLHARRQAWMLSRIKFRFAPEYPRIRETIRLETWPAGIDRIFARREFRFTDESGREFAAATSLWLIVDTENLRILPAARELADAPLPDDLERPYAFPEIGKLPAAAGETVNQYRITENLVDINCHLNNAEYAGFVQDALGPGRYPAELQINFQKSIPPGSLLAVAGTQDAERFRFSGLVGGVTHFEAAGLLFN